MDKTLAKSKERDLLNLYFMKSKTTAYLLWFFLGGFSAHRFYLGKVGSGILYLCTFQLFFVGWIIDGFCLSGMVDRYNAIYGRGGNGNVNTNMNNIVVNVGDSGQSKSPDMHEQLQKLAELKEKGLLSEVEFNSQKAKLLG
ncbi:MAG: NINE protein [Prevotellaceae bacterium]|jgi:TM2 domain-containing membrane protein YozV|nr:NINE protein [Prevotellaceae bacterium]